MFVFAYDAAMSGIGSKLVSAGCSVNDLVRALFQDDVAEKILASTPDNVASTTSFKEAFANSHTRFTQFVKLGDSSAPNQDMLCAAYVRGMAFICHPTLEVAHFVWPYLRDKDAPIHPDNMGAVVVQVNNSSTGGAAAYDVTAEDLDMFGAASADDQRPYCTILMALGAPSASVETVSAEKRQSSGLPVHPRYNIRAFGCSSAEE